MSFAVSFKLLEKKKILFTKLLLFAILFTFWAELSSHINVMIFMALIRKILVSLRVEGKYLDAIYDLSYAWAFSKIPIPQQDERKRKSLH